MLVPVLLIKVLFENEVKKIPWLELLMAVILIIYPLVIEKSDRTVTQINFRTKSVPLASSGTLSFWSDGDYQGDLRMRVIRTPAQDRMQVNMIMVVATIAALPLSVLGVGAIGSFIGASVSIGDQ